MSCFYRLRMYDSIDRSKTGNLRTGLQGLTLIVQGVGSSEVVNNIHFCKDGENVLAMRALVKTGWSLHVGAILVGLHHDTTHNLICLKQIRDLDCLLWRILGKTTKN